MLTRMSSKHAFIRRASALGLILSFLLLNGLYANPPWGGVVLRTDPAIQTKYDGLTLAELQREAYDLMKRVQDLSGRYHEEEMRLFFRENNELMLNDSDWKIEIMTKEAEIENQRNAQNQLSQEATRDWRGQLFPEDKLRMEAHEETIRKLRSEIGELQKRVNQGVRMREELAKRAAPELKAAKAQFKAETEQLMADRKTIAEVAERKFGRDVLWQAEPIARPSLPGPPQNPETIKATEVSRPPGDTLRVVEPEPGSRLGHLWRTLKRGLVDVVYEKMPEFVGAAQRALLVAFEQGKEKVKEYLLRQGRAEAAAALSGESPEVRAEVSRAVEAVVEPHAERVAEVCVDRGNAVMNAQPEPVKRSLFRGRFMAEWWEKAKASLTEGKVAKILWGLNAVFIAVAIWDIGNYVYEGKYAQAAATGALFVLISGGLYLAGLAGQTAAVVAGATNILLLAVGVYHLYSRVTSYLSSLVESYYERQYARFIMDGEPCVMDGPKGLKINDPKVGFFNFPFSPAFGLNRDSWFLKFTSRDAVFQALRDYRNALAYHFQGHWNVPPLFDPADNLLVFEKVIIREWAQKWKENRDRVEAELQKLRAEMAAREASLQFPVRGLPLPDPQSHIFSILMSPESPTAGSPVEFRPFFGVTALPGDTLAVIARSEVVKAGGGPAGIAPILDPRDFSLQLAEGVKVYAGRAKFAVSAPGDYEYVLNIESNHPGFRPESRRLRFSVGEAETPSPCGFNFWAHKDDGAVDELLEKLKEKMGALVPALPLYGQSKSLKEGRTFADPTKGSYDVENGGIVSIPGGTSETFGLRWDVGFRVEDPSRPSFADDLKREQKPIKERMAGRQEFVEGAIGPHSWLGAEGARGSVDLNSSGDPYMSGAEVVLLDSCLSLAVSAGLASFPSAAHGPRDKPAVIEAMRAAAKEKALAAAKVIHESATAALLETVALMKSRASVKTPTPGTYEAQSPADHFGPERSMTLNLKAGVDGKLEFEGEVKIPEGIFKVKGTFDPKEGYLDGRLFSPGTSVNEFFSGEYLQYRRGFLVQHSFTRKDDEGNPFISGYRYFCRFAGR